MKSFFLQADGLLRGSLASGRGFGQLPQLTGYLLICGLFYGGVMGTFGGVTGERLWQVVISASKVPLLLFVTFLIALPSFFVLNSLFGVRSDFPEVLRALVLSQAGLAIVLSSLAPYTVLWYASSANYHEAILFNGLMFAIASVAAQWLLRRAYRPLVARDPRHRWLLRCWLFLYVFVGIQLGWVLRPFVGYPGLPTQFFRKESWGNAYVMVAQMIWKVVNKEP